MEKMDSDVFENVALQATKWAGSPRSFVIAAGVIVVWLLSGPFFGFSDTWQLVINTGTTIVTFLMVFLIQNTQNKDTLAIELKLNELVAAIDGANNRLICVEDLSTADLATLNLHYRQLALLAQKESPVARTHSLGEAAIRHQRKVKKP
jgi:low affinity Fe/Cu permease